MKLNTNDMNKFLTAGIDVFSKYQISSDGKVRHESWVIRPAGILVAGGIIFAGYFMYRGIKAITKNEKEEEN